MIWAAAIYQFKAVVANNYLDKFNAEASRVNRVWRPAETSDDLGLMKEADFSDRLGNNSKNLIFADVVAFGLSAMRFPPAFGFLLQCLLPNPGVRAILFR